MPTSTAATIPWKPASGKTYCWLLTPEIDRFVDMKTILWDATRISGGTDSIVSRASRKMQQSETLITKWAPALLQMELNEVLWKDADHIQIKKLWEYLCTYCYLPRLAKFSVLEDAIRTGLNSQEYFALAAGYTGDRYVELRYNQFVDCINTSDLLVKLDPARKQLLAEKSAPAVSCAAYANCSGRRTAHPFQPSPGCSH